MAEIAAGAIVAEQVVSTTVEAGAAAALAKPTQPLQAYLSQIATSPAGDATLALARSHHTVTTINGKAYIFGGQRPDGSLCSTDVHAVSLPNAEEKSEYACYPALAMRDVTTGEALVPCPRKGHAACARDNYLVIHGGSDALDMPIKEACIWLWDAETLRWTRVPTTDQIGKVLRPRYDHHLFFAGGSASDGTQDAMVLHGGRTAPGATEETAETWLYTFDTLSWTEMPPGPAPPRAAAFARNVLYTVSRDAQTAGDVNFLDIKTETEREKPGALAWHTVGFPANPLVPGPRPREGGALLPLSTGLGRDYLVYMFGHKDPEDTSPSGDDPFVGDIWSLQLPTKGFTPAAVKDAIRGALPRVDSGELSWEQVELLPVVETEKAEGKAHPGPRGFFGADAVGDKGVVFWGGENAKGEREGDGWYFQLQ